MECRHKRNVCLYFIKILLTRNKPVVRGVLHPLAYRMIQNCWHAIIPRLKDEKQNLVLAIFAIKYCGRKSSLTRNENSPVIATNWLGKAKSSSGLNCYSTELTSRSNIHGLNKAITTVCSVFNTPPWKIGFEICVSFARFPYSFPVYSGIAHSAPVLAEILHNTPIWSTRQI